jgi:hypothetical protein
MGIRKVEKVLVVFVIIGILFKILHLPGGYPFIILGVGSLSIVYFLSGVINKSSTPKWLEKIFTDENQNNLLVPNLVFGYVFSVGLIGILFKVMRYPGNEPMLNVAVIGLAIAFIVSYFQLKDKFMEKVSPYFTRIFIIGGLVAVFYLIPNASIIDFYYGDYPEYAKVLKELDTDPYNAALRDSANVEYEKMMNSK